MDQAQLHKYFSNIQIEVMFSSTHIDYDDIERPIKSLIRSADTIQLLPGRHISSRYVLVTHEFRDVVKPLQLFAEPVTDVYLNLEETSSEDRRI